MKLFKCQWRFHGDPEFVSFYLRARSHTAAMDHMIAQYAQQNPLIQISRPVEINPKTKQVLQP